ncbi:hypothetical protein [Phytoactinopolyspora limicola]|uniref:hypothetical protein n=1 Tax=Phytoactinopolyspora limicola TaxID=2715536 RepID=UPI00140E21F1|nr:hypothetical protein [Phytoactinopolyspora limicola]
MSVEFVPPTMPTPHRVLLLGAATGWYDASDEERRDRALPRFAAVVEEWRRLGARPLATLDDDLFMVGPPSGPDFTWYLLFEVDDLDVVVAMIQAVRESVDGVRLDEYVRFQARIGRPFFLLEN